MPNATFQTPCHYDENDSQINTEVVSLSNHWLSLNMRSQDTRVSKCPLPLLEVHVKSLCELSKRQVPAYLTRSSDAMAGKISEIFRATMRVIVGRATSRAQAFVLPFASDSSSPYLQSVSQFNAHLQVLFGPEIYSSLTDPCYWGHWNQLGPTRLCAKTVPSNLSRVCAIWSNPRQPCIPDAPSTDAPESSVDTSASSTRDILCIAYRFCIYSSLPLPPRCGVAWRAIHPIKLPRAGDLALAAATMHFPDSCVSKEGFVGNRFQFIQFM
jgi:hypothetical protein